MQLMTERLESLKAGILGGFSLATAFIITNLLNSLLIKRYWPTLIIEDFTQLNLNFLVPGVSACFSGLLFGVTYRYIIRADQNPQLKAGAIFAFGLVRGLTQIEIGWNISAILPFLLLAGESVLCFAWAGVILNTAITRGWVKAYKGM